MTRRTGKDGDLAWTTCEVTGKRRYESRKAARKAAARGGIRGVNAYECTRCGGHHLGHLPKMVRDGDAVRWELQPKVDS